MIKAETTTTTSFTESRRLAGARTAAGNALRPSKPRRSLSRHVTSADVKIAPSTYYASLQRPASARAMRNEELTVEIQRLHKGNCGVYGIAKSMPSSVATAFWARAGSGRSRAAPRSGC